MRRAKRVGLGWILGAAWAAAPALAGCPEGQREFRGAISAIDAHKLFVESRLADNIGFERAAETRVTDATGGRRASWEQLRAGDVVEICWRFEDRPRKALTITLEK